MRADERTDGQTEIRMYGRTDRQTDGRTDRQADGQTGMAKLIVAFRNIVNANKNNKFSIYETFSRD